MTPYPPPATSSYPGLVQFPIGLTSGGTGQATAYAGLDALTVKGADIASSSTTDLSAATGCYVNITGTTTITALGTSAAGVTRICQFSGALTITHNATSLILPGATNILTSAGDVATFVSLGSGNWICTGFQHSVVTWSGQFALLSTATASSSATIDFTWAANRTYQEYLVIFSNILPATTSTTLQALTSADGSAWDSGAGNYGWTTYQYNTGAFSNSDTKMTLAGTTAPFTTTSGHEASGEFRLFDTGASKYGKTTWFFNTNCGGVARHEYGAGTRLSAAAVRGIRFKFSSGNIASGDFRLYGIAR